jgi:hypothetical protein
VIKAVFEQIGSNTPAISAVSEGEPKEELMTQTNAIVPRIRADHSTEFERVFERENVPNSQKHLRSGSESRAG